MVVVVGAGLSGLVLSRELSRRGVEHRVFEASDRPGGVIRSGRVEGRVLEWGPQRARMTADLAEIVQELEIEDEVLVAPAGLPLFVYRRGALRRVPFGLRDFLTSDILRPAGKLRFLLEPFTRGALPDESAAGFFTRKFGREAYENLFGPLFGGLYASDPADMRTRDSLDHTLQTFGVGRSILYRIARALAKGTRVPAATSFRDGMQTLTDALYRRQRAQVRLNAAVRELSREGGRWSVVLDDDVVAASDVVLTLPASPAARLLERAAPAAARRFEALRYNPLGVVHLHAETDLEGLGYQVSLAEDLITRGVTWNDSMFGRKGVYTAYLGGARHPEAVDHADERLGGIAMAEFELITGFEARVLAVAREAMPAWDRSWAALEGLELPDGLHICANWLARPGIPGRLADARRTATVLAARSDPAIEARPS